MQIILLEVDRVLLYHFFIGIKIVMSFSFRYVRQYALFGRYFISDLVDHILHDFYFYTLIRGRSTSFMRHVLSVLASMSMDR